MSLIKQQMNNKMWKGRQHNLLGDYEWSDMNKWKEHAENRNCMETNTSNTEGNTEEWKWRCEANGDNHGWWQN